MAATFSSQRRYFVGSSCSVPGLTREILVYRDVPQSSQSTRDKIISKIKGKMQLIILLYSRDEHHLKNTGVKVEEYEDDKVRWRHMIGCDHPSGRSPKEKKREDSRPS